MKAAVQFYEIVVHDMHFSGDNQSRLQMTARFRLQIANADNRVCFDIPNCSVDLAQPWGTQFGDPFEVGPPNCYQGNWNYQAFSELVENFVRELVGPTGRLLHISEDSTNVEMKNCVLGCQSQVFVFDLPN
ncbi:hypothetical protein [Woeseia oceani]|uniref:Uncharacterized protein n=1 Tax=Woeseia oceani TaxID=1548547 RepID=A0A193LG81_9GAMM|nr:hypothetical protein [Woeseia oceani]ANO51374.1 hypothetical protein BA177_09335 [Woeseia oceani]